MTKRRKRIEFFDKERRLDKSWGVFGGIVGIFESKAASSAQLKGAEEIVLVAGVGDSEMGIRGSSEKVTVGDRGSVCVDMDAEEDGGIIGEFV